ncbi:hypothetical protein [Lacisediminihabitans sp. H27-G8]|uniref:hypothetical protein n=1 Tax=Lacisediminihabitans sp. H27-G8 TaxID=3111909 RepID=UPI0038FCBB18
MKSFEDVLHNFDTSQTALDTHRDTATIVLDESVLPAPVSSFEHVARSTASRESLVPPKPLWPFGLRTHPHRQAS